MSIEIGLQRIDEAGAAGPRRIGVLGELRQAAQRVLAEAERLDDTTVADDGKSFTVMVPGGTASVYESCAVFPLVKLDSLWLRMVFAIARTGDMIVVGDGLEILTDPAQPRPAWVPDDKVMPVCSSPDELRLLIDPWHQRISRYADEMRRELSEAGLAKPSERIPGLIEDSQSATIYVQLRSDESTLDLWDASGRFYRVTRRDHSPGVPTLGGKRGSNWLICTPTGEVFNPIIVKGDKEGWLTLLGNFASSQSRLTGRIENGAEVSHQ